MQHKLFFFGDAYDKLHRLEPFYNDKWIRKMAAGFSHQLILTDEYRLYTTGEVGTEIFKESQRNNFSIDITNDAHMGEGEFIVNIATKGWHNLLVTNFGKVLSFGSNSHGQCGVGIISDMVREITTISRLYKKDQSILFVATGLRHSMVAGKKNVYTFGNGSDGRLGHGYLNSYYTPRKVKYFEKLFGGARGLYVVQIACSCYSSLVLDNLGTVHIMGSYMDGAQLIPVEVKIDAIVKSISCGNFFIGLVTIVGDLYFCGDNRNGQSGVHNETEIVINPTKLLTLSNIRKIACGSHNVVALSNDGRVYTWGKGGGRLGRDDDDGDNFIPRELRSMRNKNIKQLEATGSYIALCNTECFDGKKTLGKYQRNNLIGFIANQATIPFGDICVRIFVA